MADLNSVTIAGRLTRDAEIKYTTSGIAIVSISLAVNTRKRSGDEWVDEANFFDVTIFGKAGEALNAYLQKGKAVAVEGSLRQDRWESDGQSRSKVSIIANNVMLLGGSPGANSREDSPSEKVASSPSKKPSTPTRKDDFEDDIPF